MKTTRGRSAKEGVGRSNSQDRPSNQGGKGRMSHSGDGRPLIVLPYENEKIVDDATHFDQTICRRAEKTAADRPIFSRADPLFGAADTARQSALLFL